MPRATRILGLLFEWRSASCFQGVVRRSDGFLFSALSVRWYTSVSYLFEIAVLKN